MYALCSHMRAKTSTPLFDCVVNHALIQAFTFLNDTLSQRVHILDFLANFFPKRCSKLYLRDPCKVRSHFKQKIRM